MKSTRKVWELQGQTVCKVIGMALDLDDLKRIGKRFGIHQSDPLLDHEFALHSTAVQLCRTDNPVARHIQKILENRFTPYARRLSAMAPTELIESVANGSGNPDIPLWAVLWNLSLRGLDNGVALETALFGYIHMLEHRLLRDYWKNAVKREHERQRDSEAADLLMKANRRILDLERELRKSEKDRDALRAGLPKSRPPEIAPQTVLRPVVSDPGQSSLNKRIIELKRMLSDARQEKRQLEQERDLLRNEVALLSQEIAVNFGETLERACDGAAATCPLRNILRERHVAMVGGIGSLEPHYRSVVQAMGGTFQRHDGACRNGVCPLEDCIRRADLVVCPVDVNSHNGAKAVKKLCKNYGVPCRFLRTAGLGAFKVALEEHFSQSQVA